MSRYLRALSLPLLVLLAGLGLGFFEYHQARRPDLQPPSHPRSQPQLQGAALRQLAQVLLELYPDTAEPNILMGASLVEQGRLAEARPYLEKALAIDRHDQQLLLLYARLLLDQGEPPEKIQPIVDELRRKFPRSREKVETYFSQASKGKLRFAEEGY